jgi:hypothetical protein
MNGELRRMWKEAVIISSHYRNIHLEVVRETLQKLSQDSWCFD